MGQPNFTETPTGTVPTAADRMMILRKGKPAYVRPADFKEGMDTLAALATLDVGPGPGITNGTGTICEIGISRAGPVITTTILLDLTGLNSGGTAGDLIGVNGAGAAYLCQIDYARMGTVLGGKIECLETPAGGDTDFDVYAATEATGVEDTAVSALAETELVNAGAHSAGTVDALVAPADAKYIYLVNQGTGNATYTAGKFILTFYGVAA